MAESNLSTSGESMLAHMVYFSLHEPTAANKQKMLDACHKYLSGHPGVVLYAAGTCAHYDRPVNDRDFDIALQVVFTDQAAHDAYQNAPRHLQFIEECKPMWKKVRVFDADVAAG
jgi:quinol monooxygenase YgiN